ncbi:MAG: hypothetical protein Q8L52_03295 [bacterium]|nr:hypothetical protein [bacterium]
MALPPTIPTSFVPRSASATAHRFRTDGIGTFSYFAYISLGIAFVLAISVFFYDRVLAGTLSARDAALATAQKSIDLSTVESFVQLRDRLNFGTTLLSGHVALSGFFKLIAALLPSTTRFTSLHLTINDARKVSIEGLGAAKNFNALAAVSTAFATDGHIKDAIFSNIVVNRDGTVSFVLSATLDPKVVAFAP